MTIEFKQQLLDDMIIVELKWDVQSLRLKLPDWARTLTGTVIATGPGKLLYTGKRAPMETTVGDVVSFAATAGMECDFGVGKKVRMMRDKDVDAVLT